MGGQRWALLLLLPIHPPACLASFRRLCLRHGGARRLADHLGREAAEVGKEKPTVALTLTLTVALTVAPLTAPPPAPAPAPAPARAPTPA